MYICPNCFQSHFGLILSWNSTFRELLLCLSFNPILVWFYLKFRLTSFTSRSSFQSHFGLILSSVPLFRVRTHSEPFNPILVWFYLLPNHPLRRTGLELSIPFWSDFIVFIPWLMIILSIAFQSHFGLILSVMKVLPTCRFRDTFNPILVWFYRS